MFQKVLVANRGEIAVRIIRTCREMGVATVAVYETVDEDALHVRLADESWRLPAGGSFFDGGLLLEGARAAGCDAVHPGYGFLAENAAFAADCATAGLTFIGPSATVIAGVTHKISALERVAEAGFPTVTHSSLSFNPDEPDLIMAMAKDLGYPLVLKSCHGGRGPGERLVHRPAQLERALGQALAETRAIYREQKLYFEQAILPCHQVGVQIAGDRYGALIHLGEREGSIIFRGRKVVEESPAPCLNEAQRADLCAAAVALGHLFNYDNVGTVEFFIDETGRFFFSEIKARLQVEHTLTELRGRIDLVRLQIEAAAGRTLPLTQEDIRLGGHALLARLRAEDPGRGYLPSPGRLEQVRFPGGPGVRVDGCVASGSEISGRYDPLFAKISAWGADRPATLARLRRALDETRLTGTTTNLAALAQVIRSEAFVAGRYHTGTPLPTFEPGGAAEVYLRDLAAIAGVLYTIRNQSFQPVAPARLAGGWHRQSRALPG